MTDLEAQISLELQRIAASNMNTTNLQRDLLTEQVLDATTLPEIAAAKQALRDWIKAHPEDAGMGDAFEQLYLLEEIALSQQTEALRAAQPLSTR